MCCNSKPNDGILSNLNKGSEFNFDLNSLAGKISINFFFNIILRLYFRWLSQKHDLLLHRSAN